MHQGSVLQKSVDNTSGDVPLVVTAMVIQLNVIYLPDFVRLAAVACISPVFFSTEVIYRGSEEMLSQ